MKGKLEDAIETHKETLCHDGKTSIDLEKVPKNWWSITSFRCGKNTWLDYSSEPLEEEVLIFEGDEVNELVLVPNISGTAGRVSVSQTYNPFMYARIGPYSRDLPAVTVF